MTWQEVVEARQVRIRARLTRSRMDSLPTAMLAYLPRLTWHRWLFEQGHYQQDDPWKEYPEESS